jgi:hypothetical protein
MQLRSEPWIPDKQILEICHCRSETTLLTPNSSCEACSRFTHVTARWIARPPNAAFVTRLRSVRLLVQTARQLLDHSTTLWVEPSAPSGRTIGLHIGRRHHLSVMAELDQLTRPRMGRAAASSPTRHFGNRAKKAARFCAAEPWRRSRVQRRQRNEPERHAWPIRRESARPSLADFLVENRRRRS